MLLVCLVYFKLWWFVCCLCVAFDMWFCVCVWLFVCSVTVVLLWWSSLDALCFSFVMFCGLLELVACFMLCLRSGCLLGVWCLLSRCVLVGWLFTICFIVCLNDFYLCCLLLCLLLICLSCFVVYLCWVGWQLNLCLLADWLWLTWFLLLLWLFCILCGFWFWALVV